MQTSLLNFSDDRLTPYEAQAAALQDMRPHPSEGAVAHAGVACVTELLDLLADSALEDFQPVILESLIGAFHSAAQRIEREADRARDDLKRAHRDFDGTEIADTELQELTRKTGAADVAVMALELMRDHASQTYTVNTGEVWTPWKGSVKPNRVTAAVIEASDALRTARAKKSAATDAGAQIVVFRGSPKANTQEDAARIFDALNWARQEYPDMALATSGAPGAEKLAIQWAEQKKVRIVLARADFDKHARSAPFRANDQLIDLDPVLCLTLDNTLNAERGADTKDFGPSLNIGQKAAERGLKHIKIKAR